VGDQEENSPLRKHRSSLSIFAHASLGSIQFHSMIFKSIHPVESYPNISSLVSLPSVCYSAQTCDSCNSDNSISVPAINQYARGIQNPAIQPQPENAILNASPDQTDFDTVVFCSFRMYSALHAFSASDYRPKEKISVRSCSFAPFL
jgi:hypothetical protein